MKNCEQQKKTVDNLYIKETEVWIRQQHLRLQGCVNSIVTNDRDIANLRAVNRLERQQATIVRSRIRKCAKKLSDYKKKYGIK